MASIWVKVEAADQGPMLENFLKPCVTNVGNKLKRFFPDNLLQTSGMVVGKARDNFWVFQSRIGSWLYQQTLDSRLERHVKNKHRSRQRTFVT